MTESGWLEHDEVPVAEVPPWARTGGAVGSSVRLLEPGIVFTAAGGLVSVARWQDVLGVASLPPSERFLPQAFVLVPRRPPRPPWFVVGPGVLPPELRAAGTVGFADQVRQRISSWGYRSADAGRPRLPPEEVLERVLARDALPGAVEVPIGPPPDRLATGWRQALGFVSVAGGSAVMSGYLGLLVGGILGAALVQPWLAALALPAAAAGGAVGLGVGMHQRGRSLSRVLVMTPDACVVAFYDGVRALGWGAIAAFRKGALYRPDLQHESPALEVVGHDGNVVGRVEAHWFSVPLDVVVAVGEAYRGRVAGVAAQLDGGIGPPAR